jgi:hypothetical protein
MHYKKAKGLWILYDDDADTYCNDTKDQVYQREDIVECKCLER